LTSNKLVTVRSKGHGIIEAARSELGTAEKGGQPVSFLWAEITGKCNLRCVHCYAESSPTGSHGRLTAEQWKVLISEAKDLGTETVQFIGGEPTVHPQFPELVRHAASEGLSIEVYTNLVRMRLATWELFEACSVSVATSFYSVDPGTHNRITSRNSQHRTLGNIKEALRRGLPLRVGIVQVLPNQNVSATVEMLKSLGIEAVGVDVMRGVGRGAIGNQPDRPVDALCGSCGSTNAAIDPEGWVYPCVFSRWLKVGNVTNQGLSDIVLGERMAMTKGMLNQEFAHRCNKGGKPKQALVPVTSCYPDRIRCSPSTCFPEKTCSPHEDWTEGGGSRCRPEMLDNPDQPTCRPQPGNWMPNYPSNPPSTPPSSLDPGRRATAQVAPKPQSQCVNVEAEICSPDLRTAVPIDSAHSKRYRKGQRS
jgi:MoaA/NifB/PqqE/SkfB family radical SAM enzyme